jgi:hypothetical protein
MSDVLERAKAILTNGAPFPPATAAELVAGCGRLQKDLDIAQESWTADNAATAIPDKMVLAPAQRAALEWAMELMGECGAAKVIAAMLSQSRPAWQVTEERIAALDEAADRLGSAIDDEDGEIWASEPQMARELRAMLDEVRAVEKYISSEAHK